MTKLTFDAIVVGAGPAGTSAAITMAKSGLKVILIERGRFAGSKNLFGGVLYTEAIGEVLPDFAKRIPSPPFECVAVDVQLLFVPALVCSIPSRVLL